MSDLSTVDALDRVFREGRSLHSFTAEPVTAEEIRAAQELAQLGPTSLNSQPLRVVVIESAQARGRLLPLLSASNRAKSEGAPLILILAADLDFHERLPELFPARPEARDYFAEAGYREAQARFNASIQIGYFILALRAVGLGAGPMAGFDAAAVDLEFFPSGTRKSLLIVNVGRPDDGPRPPRLPRLSFAEVVTVEP